MCLQLEIKGRWQLLTIRRSIAKPKRSMFAAQINEYQLNLEMQRLKLVERFPKWNVFPNGTFSQMERFPKWNVFPNGTFSQ